MLKRSPGRRDPGHAAPEEGGDGVEHATYARRRRPVGGNLHGLVQCARAFIHVEGFLGIHEGALDALPRLGILVGPNGSGKSSLLEALLIGAHSDPGGQIGKVVRSRQTPRGARWIFEKGAGKPASILVESEELSRATTLEYSSDDDGVNEQIRWRCEPGSLTTRQFGAQRIPHQREARSVTPSVRWLEPFSPFQAALHDVYTEVVTEGRRPAAKQIIKAVIPGFDDIEILVEGGQPVVHVVADHSVPEPLWVPA